ncbi:MAG TPA: hypothetical protein VMQ78_10845 [Candidatus Limnocylindria bacterium]|nr:hypothetical protein [Candidatus Limnocylindria bacterium]
MTSISKANTTPNIGEAPADQAAERKRARLAALALIASPALWFVGALAFFTTLGAFYTTDDPVAKLNGIAGQRVAWTVQSVLFALGGLTAAAGLIIVARLLRSDVPALARAGMVAASSSAIATVAILAIRLAAPLDGVRDVSEVPPLLLAVHSSIGAPSLLGNGVVLVTVAAVALVAIALYTSRRAKVTGALVALACSVVALAIIARGGLPPVVVYPIAAVLGVRLLFWRPIGS